MNATGGFVGHKGDYSTVLRKSSCRMCLVLLKFMNNKPAGNLCWKTAILLCFGLQTHSTTMRIAWMSTDQKGLNISKIPSKWKTYYLYRPTKSETCQMLNAEWIPVNTATDVPLMLGIAHTLVEQGKHDKDFLKKYTSGYAKFEEYLLGKTDGQPKTAEWAAKICGVPAETIKQLAADFS